MRITRCVIDGDPFYGLVEDEQVIELAGDPFFHGVQPTQTVHALDDVRLVAPIIPRSKVVGFGKNYAEHAREMGGEAPARPVMFLIPNTAVLGPGEPIRFPDFSDEISYEGELAVVIGRICKDVPPENAHEVVFGYTIANDLTARDAQRNDGQWSRAKGFDGSVPLGPWIETELDPDALAITTTVDGKTVQDGNTRDMLTQVAGLIAQASEAFTLLPGDVLLTGTPAGVGLLQEGQTVEVTIEGIGTLSNRVM